MVKRKGVARVMGPRAQAVWGMVGTLAAGSVTGVWAQADTASPEIAPANTGSPAASAPADAASAALPKVTVVGRSESGAYKAQEVSGSKSQLPVRELPQSVRVMTRQTLDDLGATRLDDALDYVGGVSRQNNFGGLWDNVAIRGLAGHEDTGMSTLFNGFAGNRGFNAPRDMAAVERIEFLKGPAAALYGSSEPGGTLNVVSKRPARSAAHAVEGSLGTQGFKRGALDSTGALSESLAYRLNVAAESRDSFRDHLRSRRQVFAPALTWQLSEDSVLDYTGEVLRHRAPLDRGVVAVSSKLDAIPRNRFLGEPGDGDIAMNQQTHQWVLAQDWSADWRSRVGYSYRVNSLYGLSTEASALQDDGQTLWRQRRKRNYDSTDHALQAELMGQVSTSQIIHELLVGAETYTFTQDQVMDRFRPSAESPNAIDIFTPTYGQQVPTLKASVDTHEKQRGTAVYLQDTLPLGTDWRFMAGLRLDKHQQSSHNRIKDQRTEQSPQSTTPRVGLSWLPTPRWSAYANVGQSFRPNQGTDEMGRSFEPEKGTAYEVGTKWENERGNLGATAALFDIRKHHVLTANPQNNDFKMATGEVQSRGLELDVSGQLSTAWRVNGSWVLNQAKVVQDNELQVGGRLLNVPKTSGSLLAVYEKVWADGQRWGTGGGFTHVGKRLGQAYTQEEANAGTPAFDLPSYTTAKLLSYWRFNSQMRLSLDVDNLFDKTYYVSSYNRTWVAPGAERSVALTLQAKL